ncbi:MAG: DUF732 domain-containing protein [Mycobacterium sp.]|uniref:DUF732 domain-containing protein n=1 Tax=Mycobacterium sp. TaxID=1785 RepID=UPI0026154AFD|nr:DUF732 domain-containing protein [Mycobacterium sp.]MDI3312936.1 DUF732 domain-containing protein [Mycobacterium sp.]
MSDETSSNTQVSLEPPGTAAIYAWGEEPEGGDEPEHGYGDRRAGRVGRLLRNLDGRIIPAAIAAMAVLAAAFAGTLAYSSSQPEHFSIAPVPIVQVPAPNTPAPAPKTVPRPLAVSPKPQLAAPQRPAVPAPAVQVPRRWVPSQPPPVVQPPPQPGADQKFLNSLARDGIYFRNVPVGIASAHDSCQALENGETVQQLIHETQLKSPDLDYRQAIEGTYDAIDAYCPQFDNR